MLTDDVFLWFFLLLCFVILSDVPEGSAEPCGRYKIPKQINKYFLCHSTDQSLRVLFLLNNQTIQTVAGYCCTDLFDFCHFLPFIKQLRLMKHYRKKEKINGVICEVAGFMG